MLMILPLVAAGDRRDLGRIHQFPDDDTWAISWAKPLVPSQPTMWPATLPHVRRHGHAENHRSNRRKSEGFSLGLMILSG